MDRKYRNDVREATAEAPFWTGQVFKVFLILTVLGIGFSVVSYTLGWFGEAAQVAREELGPRAVLKKYEWFKDAAAQLDKKRADIQVYQGRVTGMKDSYVDTPRKDWDRTDKEQLNLWNVEVAGVIASFNGLAADYNAQMSKINWRFAEVGQLPPGAKEVLPREFKPYQTH